METQVTRKLTTKEFIEKAKAKHGDEYIYEKASYVSAFQKLTVTCKVHGDWLVRPDAHTRSGHGCPECKKLKIRAANGHTTEQVVAAFQSVHGDRYDYSLVKHVRDHERVTVICRSHGAFECSPANHKAGKGCPACGQYGYRPNKPGSLYILNNENFVKVGITNAEVQTRVDQINRTTSDKFKIVASYSYQDGRVPKDIECQMLKHLRQMCRQSEQTFDGSTECFEDADVDAVLGILESIRIYQKGKHV